MGANFFLWRSDRLDKVFVAAQFQFGDTTEGIAARQLMETEVLPVMKRPSG